MSPVAVLKYTHTPVVSTKKLMKCIQLKDTSLALSGSLGEHRDIKYSLEDETVTLKNKQVMDIREKGMLIETKDQAIKVLEDQYLELMETSEVSQICMDNIFLPKNIPHLTNPLLWIPLKAMEAACN